MTTDVQTGLNVDHSAGPRVVQDNSAYKMVVQDSHSDSSADPRVVQDNSADPMVVQDSHSD